VQIKELEAEDDASLAAHVAQEITQRLGWATADSAQPSVTVQVEGQVVVQPAVGAGCQVAPGPAEDVQEQLGAARLLSARCVALLPRDECALVEVSAAHTPPLMVVGHMPCLKLRTGHLSYISWW
jgi:hypothetical protein